MNLVQISLVGKALSDPNRLRIIQLLTYGEQCGCELLEQMQISQSTLSHHMKMLEDSGLVSSVRKGKWSHYSLNKDQWSAFRDYIESVRAASKNESRLRFSQRSAKRPHHRGSAVRATPQLTDL